MDNLCNVSKETAYQLGYTKGHSDAIRHGNWLHTTMIDGHVHGECSECHHIRIIDNYCPNCGCIMSQEVQ